MIIQQKNQRNSSGKSIQSLITKKNRQVLKNRMRSHFHNLQRELHKTYNDINSEVSNENGKLVHPVLEELTELNFKLKELIDGLDKTFELFIIGMGNYGKSTLINALLEQKAADIDVRPTTWKVDVYDSTITGDKCVVVYRNGGTEYKPLEETKAFLANEEGKAKESKKKVKTELKKVLPELKTKEAIKETENYIKKEFLYQSDVVEVRWPINATNHLSNKFMVVDTPGLVQENLSGETIVSVQKYYHKADGVIWILDATKLASKKSKDMVDELEKSISKIGGKTDNIIAVLNRIDLVRQNGGKEAEEKAIAEANKIFGKYFDNFICISAKQALNGVINGDDQQREESGIENLIKAIDSNFYENARKIQLQSKEMSYKQIINDLTEDSHLIKAYLNRLTEEQQLYIKRREQIIGKFKTAQESYKKELENLTASYLQNATNRINTHARELFDLETRSERKNYIENHLFRLNVFESELERLYEYWTSEIEDMMKELVAEVTFPEYKHIDTDVLNKMFETSGNGSKGFISYKFNSTNKLTNNLNLSSVGDNIENVGFVSEIIKALGTELTKLFKGGGLKRDLNKSFSDHVESVKVSVVDDLDRNKEKAKENVLKDFNQSFTNLHGPYESSLEVEKSLSELYDTLEKRIVYPDVKTLLMYDKWKYLNVEV